MGGYMDIQRKTVRVTRTKPALGRFRNLDFPRFQTFCRRAISSLEDHRGRIPRATDIRVQRIFSPDQKERLLSAKYKYAAKRAAREQVAILTECPPCELLDRVLQAESILCVREGPLRDSP